MSDDPAFEFARQLANDPRSYRAIADALEAAAQHEGDDHIGRGGILARQLVARYMEIDQISVARVLMVLVAYMARRTGRTPREVHEELFKAAPEDAWWHERMLETE